MATVYKNQIFKGYMKAQQAVHKEIRFEYKGMWPEYRAAYFSLLRAQGEDDEKSETIILDRMSKLIVKWNLEYPDHHPDKTKAGKPVPITVEALRNDLMTHIRNRMMNIITWREESDIDPLLSAEEMEAQLLQKNSKKSPEELMGEADAELVGN